MRSHSSFRAALPLVVVLACIAAITALDLRAQAREERTLFVSAVDKDGAPVPDLGPDAFVITEDGRRREVLRVSRATEPIDITVMIDNSAAASEAVTFYRQALPPFLQTLGSHTISLIGLADRPTILVPSTTELPQLLKRAQSVFAQPGTGMTFLDGIVEVSAGLRKRDTGPRAAIVAIITDGTEFTDRYSKDAVEALTRARVALHLVTIGRFVQDQEHAVRERAFFIAQGPKASGGQHVSLLSPHGLEGALNRIARELSSQYKVVYARPDVLIQGDKVEISSARNGVTMRGTPARTDKGA